MTAAARSHSSLGPHWLSTRRLRDRVHRHLVALPTLRLPLPLTPDAPDGPDAGPDRADRPGYRFTVHRRVCGAVVVVGVEGEVDADCAAALDERLQRILATGNLARLVIDLGRVSVLSDAGIRALLRAQEAGLAAGIPLRVVTGDGAAGPVLDLCDVRPRIATAADVDTACTEVFRPRRPA